MKRTLLLISAAVLSVIAGVQTALAQKVVLYMSDNQTFDCDIAKLDSIVFCDGQTIPSNEIIVTVDANGNADGGHQVTRIDEATFLIDGLKYRYRNGDLTVIGYDQVLFTGIATVISKLIYNGRSMDVAGIKDNAFRDCTGLTSVIIGSGVTSIGDDAFRDCSNLTSVIIGSGVTSIGSSAFRGCRSLTSITIPESVTSIGSAAFSGCDALVSINVEQGNEKYDSRDNCNAIIETSTNTLIAGCKNTTIPENVTSIGDFAFYGCSSLTSITIPNSVTSIGRSAFSGCTNLTSVTIGSGVTSIGYYAFDSCRSLTSITIPEGVTSIGDYAFSGCTNLTSVTIGSGVTSIGSAAFSSCSSLTSITIPEGVTSIGIAAFSGCSSLTSITIPNSVTSIGNFAFRGCSSLTDVYCYAEVPSTGYDVFSGTPISSATLHVPAGSVDSYKAAAPWKNFKTIVAIE